MASNSHHHQDLEGIGLMGSGPGPGRQYLRPLHHTHTTHSHGHSHSHSHGHSHGHHSHHAMNVNQVVMYQQQQQQAQQVQQQQQHHLGLGPSGGFLHQQQHSIVATAYGPYNNPQLHSTPQSQSQQSQQYNSNLNLNNLNNVNVNNTHSHMQLINNINNNNGLLVASSGVGISGMMATINNLQQQQYLGESGGSAGRSSSASSIMSNNSVAAANANHLHNQLFQQQVNPVQNIHVNNNFIQIDESPTSTGIRDVWKFNLREEFRKIRSLARNGFNYIAIDTEFPGAPVRPVGTFRNPTEYQYQILRVNCDCLRIIQIGFTLLDENGSLPSGTCTWQFNFKFSLTDDMYASDSIELLQGSGIQFHRMETDGIDPLTFSEYLYTSGLVLNEDMRWISFHSGYDFGYMFRILMNRRIPSEETEFFTVLKLFFPYVYDIKYLMKSCKTLKGGLQELADELQVTRQGPSHQAGSDSLLTGLVFFKLREMYFEDMIDDDLYNGRLYGLAGTYYAADGDCLFPLPVDPNNVAMIPLPPGSPPPRNEMMNGNHQNQNHHHNHSVNLDDAEVAAAVQLAIQIATSNGGLADYDYPLENKERSQMEQIHQQMMQIQEEMAGEVKGQEEENSDNTNNGATTETDASSGAAGDDTKEPGKSE